MEKVNRVLNLIKKIGWSLILLLNTEIRQKAKTNFEKDFFKLMNNAVFVKSMENLRKYRDIKLVTRERRRNYLVLDPNYHTTKFLQKMY